MKRRKGWRMSCDVGEVEEGLENELWCRWSDVRVGEWGGLHTSQLILHPFRCFTYVIGTSPTSQLILQPFRRFIYVTCHSTTIPLLHLRHRHFTYVTAHSPTVPPLHLRHRSFYNPSVAWPTSQALHVLHLASRPCIGGWKNSVWWTSLLQQVTKFRSNYSFG